MPVTVFTAIDAEGYRRLFRRLLPRGILWRRLDDRLDAVLLAIGDEFARVHQRALDLVEEAFPDTASESLDAWERALDLPDPNATAPTTTADRQAAALARYIATGGQDPDYYVEVAAAMGITITITEPAHGDPFRCGVGRCGDPLNDELAIFYWQVTGPAATATAARERLEALFDRLRPAHTIPVFSWTA